MLLLSGTIEIKIKTPILGHPILTDFIVTNESNKILEITNPNVGMPPANLQWPGSAAAYKFSILHSYQKINVTIKNDKEQLIPNKEIQSWVTPIFSKRELHPYEKIVMEFDLNELFLFQLPGVYKLFVKYGDNDLYATASKSFSLFDSNIDQPA